MAFSPEYYITYLDHKDVISTIGAELNYYECLDGLYYKFIQTGDVREIHIFW